MSEPLIASAIAERFSELRVRFKSIEQLCDTLDSAAGIPATVEELAHVIEGLALDGLGVLNELQQTVEAAPPAVTAGGAQ